MFKLLQKITSISVIAMGVSVSNAQNVAVDFTNYTPTISGTTLTSTSTSVSVNWDAINGSTGYCIEVSYFSDFSRSVVNDCNLTTPNYEIFKTYKSIKPIDVGGKPIDGGGEGTPKRVEASTVLYYRIKAKNTTSTSQFSNTRMVSFEEEINLSSVTPTLSGVTFTTTSSVASVTWDAVNGATNYKIEVSRSNDFGLLLQSVSNLSVTSFNIEKPSFILEGGGKRTEASTVVYYRIFATNSISTSLGSNARMVSFEEEINLSSVTPTLSGVTFTTTSSVASVTWDAVNGATNYDIDVATSSDFSFIYQTGTSITGTSFEINKPRFKEFARTEAATVVYFRIKAKNSSSSSNFSNSRMVSFEELTSLSSVEKASSLNILYPNPSKGLISVKSASSISKSDISIINTLGESVSFEYNLGTISISTKGLYFVSIGGKTTTLIVE